MIDTIGFMYDHDTAVHFAHSETGIGEDVVDRVLLARDRYHRGLGILPAEADSERPDAIRASHGDLFDADHMARRFLSPPLEREFIVRTTGIASADVRAVQQADEKYMRKLGIID